MIHTYAVTSELVVSDTQACRDSIPRPNISHSLKVTVYETIVKNILYGTVFLLTRKGCRRVVFTEEKHVY